MIQIKNKENCCGCSACKNICPQNAIEMVEDEKKFRYPKISLDICIDCGLCEKVCPIINKQKENNREILAYAAKNKNEAVRMKSSSGGIFSLIAENIINKDGVVFGAVFNENFDVEHIKISNVNEISKIRGSKYIQSNIKETYKEAKKALEEGKRVLFTGTPCQVEGLKSYLMKDYDNLYTQDIICHGVPSKKVWDKYLDFRKNMDNDTPNSIFFRSKENEGWNKYQLLFQYNNFEKYINHSEDLFMKIFLNDIALRDSCYECKFKKKNRNSDITLADFWGINEVMPEMNDEKGTSLVLVNSEKGKELLEELEDKIEIKQVNFELAISNNPSMTTCPEKNSYREEFFKNLDNMGLKDVIARYIEKNEDNTML